MGGNVSPRVAYWTSSFEPHMEAIASEVATLRIRYPRSIAWGLSHRHWLLLSRNRGYCLHPRLHLLFRLATRLLDSAFDLHHIFGSVGDWFYLNRASRRPTVLTVAAHSPPVNVQLLERVDRFVIEYPGARQCLEHLGIESQRIRLIFPPVDLDRFRPTPPPSKPFTVLFASSPEKPDWLAARGIPEILDAAKLRPNLRFRLLWRPWGDSEGVVRKWIRENDLTNVELRVGCFREMAGEFQAAHVCVAPFGDRERAKPAPNSIVESLACGRPVVVTEQVGLADMIKEEKAGLVCLASGASLAEQLDRIQSEWTSYSVAARRLAERCFGVDAFLDSYRRLYDDVLACRNVRKRCIASV